MEVWVSQMAVADEITRVDTLMAQRRFEVAIPLLERMAFASPEDGQIWRRLTDALIANGEYERAAITSYAYEALAPSPRAYLLRSRALLAVEPHEALIPALSAQAASPEDWATHAQVARCYVAGPDAAGLGLKAAERALRLAPNVAEAYVVLALAMRRHERFEDAEVAAGKALSLDPRNTEARDVLDGLALRLPNRSSARRRDGRGLGQARLGLLLVLALLTMIVVPVTVLLSGDINPMVLAAAGTGVGALVLALLLRRASNQT